MALVGAGRIPVLDDARRAAAVLGRELDPGEVLLFGSVAQGAACSDSDLDLVLVFDDLGDYADRQQLEVRAREAVRVATGFASDVRVTDRPEWEVRARRCRSTFEAHIASHAVTLLSRPSRIPVDWDKEIGMAPSDAQQAADSLDNAANALNKLVMMLAPSQHESDALSAGDLATADSMERSRMLGACEQAQVAMETSLKALIHALEGDHPGKVHHIGELLDMAAAHLSTDAADQIRACLGPISPQHASVWRETGTYPAEIGIKGDPDTATPAFTAQMATAACNMAQTCIAAIDLTLGRLPPSAKQALARTTTIQQQLTNLDPPHRDPTIEMGL